MSRFNIDVESNVEGLPLSISPATTIITGKIRCDRGCGASYRPQPHKIFVGELVTAEGKTIPFFSTRCRDCKRVIVFTEADFPLAGHELLEHDAKTHGRASN